MSGADEYLSLFLSEARQLLAVLRKGLREVEKGDMEALKELFRCSHSLKGMAASLGYVETEQLAHALEDAFERLRKGGAGPMETMREVLWQAADALDQGIEDLGSSGEEPEMSVLADRVRDLAAATPCLEEESGESDVPLEREHSPASGDDRVGGAESRPPGTSLSITVSLEEDVELPSARAAVIRRRAAMLGTILEEQATLHNRGGELFFLLDAHRAAGEVSAALRTLTGVASVDVRLTPGGGPLRGARSDTTVRVPADVMDLLLEETTEILVQHSHLLRLVPENEVPEMRFALARLKATGSRILNNLLEARLLPFRGIVPVLERTTRDLERRLGKSAALHVEGDDIRLDRAILERLVDPLTHLLRNAMDHGLEPPDVRKEQGKPSTGKLSITLTRASDMVEVSLADDGRGMDAELLREKAVASGAIDSATARHLSTGDALLLATLPGVSTAEEKTTVSGRGVGLDAVRDRVEALGGSLHLEAEPGCGTRVVLRLPPTVAVLQVFLVRVGESMYAIPVRKIEETIALHGGCLRRTNGRTVLPWRGDVAEAFPLEASLAGSAASPGDGGVAIVYLQRGEPRAAVVDEVIGCRELVIKPLLGPLEAMGEMTGAAVLGDGTVAPVLDLENIGPPATHLNRRTA